MLTRSTTQVKNEYEHQHQEEGLRMLLNTDGFAVYRHKVAIPDISTRKYNNKDSVIIFNDIGHNDRKRSMCEVTNKKKDTNVRLLIDECEQWLKVLIPTATIFTWVELHSKPHCGQQCAHIDYQPHLLEGVNPVRYPIGCLLAIMDDTRLVVWPTALIMNPITSPIEPIVLILQAGDVVVFRADLVHAGASYDKPNSRLHCFIDNSAASHIPNTTWKIHKDPISEFIIQDARKAISVLKSPIR